MSVMVWNASHRLRSLITWFSAGVGGDCRTCRRWGLTEGGSLGAGLEGYGLVPLPDRVLSAPSSGEM